MIQVNNKNRYMPFSPGGLSTWIFHLYITLWYIYTSIFMTNDHWRCISAAGVGSQPVSELAEMLSLIFAWRVWKTHTNWKQANRDEATLCAQWLMFHLTTLWAQQLNITRTEALDRILHHHTGVYVSPGGFWDAALPLLFHIFSWPTCSELQFETEHVEMTLQSDRLCERLNAIFLSAKSVFF